MSRALWVALLLIALLPFPVHSQQQHVDSLRALVDAHPQKDTTRVRLLGQLAFAYRNTSPEESRRIANDIKTLSLTMGYRKGVGVSYQLTGISHAVQGEYGVALNSFILALDVFRQLDDSTAIGKNLSNIAGIYYNQNNFTQAEEYSKEALKIVINQGDRAAIAATSMGLGVIQERLGKYEEALERYQVALQIFEDLGLQQRVASIYRAIGTVYKSQKDYPRSMHFYKQSLQLREKIGDEIGVTSTLVSIAKLYILLGEYGQAESNLRKSEKVSKELGLNHNLIAIYAAFADLSQKRKDYQAGFMYQEKYIQYKDSVFKESTAKDMAQLKMSYEIQRSRQENELLKKDKELEAAWRKEKEDSLRNQRILNGAITLVALSMLVLLISLWLNRRQIKRTNQLLTAEKVEHEEKRSELEELNKTKDQWFAMMCHDFKQPFSFLQGALALLNEGNLSPQEQQMLIVEMEERVINNSLMLDNLLFWAQDQQHGIVVRKEQLDMESIINENIFLLDSVASKKDITIQNDVDHSALVWADRNMIHLVVRNLLDNAIKLSRSNEKVRINCEISDGSFCFHIADSGMSIPQEYLDRLFQFDSRRVLEGFAKERGMGINLLVSRDFIEKNGGQIWVRSVLGKGNVFSFSLPMAGTMNAEPEEFSDKDFDSLFDS